MYQTVQFECGVSEANRCGNRNLSVEGRRRANGQLSLHRSINWSERVVAWPAYLIGTLDQDVCDSRDANRLRCRKKFKCTSRSVWITLEQADTGQEQDEEQELHYCYCVGIDFKKKKKKKK